MSWMDDYYKALGVNSTQTTQKKKASNSWMQEYQQTLLELEEEKEKQRETIQRKTETTITPSKEEDDSLLDFFQAGALDDINLGSRFKDGYQFGDITKSAGDTLLGVGKAILGTAGDAGLEIVKGAGGMVEGIVDLAGYGSAYVADWAGKDDYAAQLRKNAQKNTLEEWTQGADDYLEQFSVLGRTSDAVAQGIGQVGTILLTGGLGQAAGLGTAGVTALTTGSMGLSGMGSGMGEAYRDGATDEEALTYGAIAGAADAATELLFGGLGKAINATGLSVGLSSADDMLAKKVSSMISGQLKKNFAEFSIKAGAEGFEEVLAGTVQAIGKWATYGSEEKTWEDFTKILNDENLLEQFVVGAIASGIAQAPSLHTSVKSGTDFITGMTQNEETVVQKEIEKRISEQEKGGKKLTAKEKAAINDRVIEDLGKGYISTDTIEEVLGGETYQRYKQTVDSENALKEKQKALQEEFDTLNKMKQGEMTGEQIDRRADLKEELAKINESVMSAENHSPKNLLQERLSKEVSEMVRSDRLIESYNERERRKQYFEADLTKYTNPKARQSVQNLMDAKVANNTNRTREMADTVAKIAEDKDIVFHFTSNQKLKEEGNAYKSMKEFTADGNTAVFELGTTKIDTDFQPIVKIGGESAQNFKVDFDKGTITFENAPAEGQISVEFRKTGMVNGFNDGKGNITINMDSPRYWNFIVGHEVTHSLEKAKAYEDLQKAVFAYAQTKGEYQGRYDSLKARYNEGTNIEQELTADLVGDYIFNDQAFVNDLSTNHQNIFQKIFSEIKYLLKIVTAGSKEARQLEKAKRMFEKAYREAGKAQKNTADGGVKYALMEYSEQQKKNWATSKRIVIYDNPQQLSQFIQDSVANKTMDKKMYFGAIPADLAARIESDAGVDVENYNLSLGSYEIRKILKDHGNEATEAPRGQRAIVEDDFAHIVDVVLNPKSVELSEDTYMGKPAIVFTGEHNGRMNVVAVVSDKRLDLFVQTAFVNIKKGNLATPTGEQAPINTPEASSGTVSKVNVAQNGGDVKHSLSDPNGSYLSDLSIDDLLKMPNEDFEQLYEDLFKDIDLELDDDILLDYDAVESISDELDADPEVVKVLFRRNGLGNSHIDSNHQAVMTQDRINQRIEEHGAGNTDYARRYITRIAPKDFIDMTVYAENMDRTNFDNKVRGDLDSKMGEWDYEKQLRDSTEPPVLVVNKATGQIIGHNGRHRVRALEIAGIESVEIEVELHDEDGYLIKYNAQTIPDMAISSQFDTAIETHISNVIPLNNAHRGEIGKYYGENANANASVKFSLSDSAGRQLSGEQQEYFKDSSVRDNDGKLMVLYHGTQNDFTVFDIGRSGENYEGGWSEYGEGIYLTPDKKSAEYYGDNAGWGREVKLMEVYANIKNPFNVNDPVTFDISDLVQKYELTEFDERHIKRAGDRLVSFLQYHKESVRDYLIGKGYDGVWEKGLNGDVYQVVAYTENQIKNVDNVKPTGDPDIRFSLSETVEETNDLVALHNLTADKLTKSLALGGLPMPSLAVTKADIPHSNFGDITLIFGRETIDPKANKKNKVYSADAWTPVFPRVEYEADSKVGNQISRKLRELESKIDDSFHRDLKRLQFGFEDYLNSQGGEEGLIQYAMENYGLKAAYLEELGKHIDKVTVQQEVEKDYNPNSADKYMKIMDILGVSTADEIGNVNLKDVRDNYGAELEVVYPGITKTAMRLGRMLNAVKSFLVDQNSAPTYRTVTDNNATRRTVDEALDAEGFEAWTRNLFAGIVKDSGIYNNKDLFTPSGNRRSFKQTHLPVTLENIVKAMASQNGGNSKNVSGFNGIKTLRAATAETFKSVADMHNRKDRLQHLTQEQADALNDEMQNRLFEIMNTIDNEGKQSSERNPYIRLDSIGETLAEIGEGGKYNVADIQNTFRQYGKEISDDTALQVKQLLYDVTQMPVNIFEAKPQRVVSFDEAKVFVIPNNTNIKLKQELLNRGYSVAEYDPNVEGDRQKVVNRFEEYRFSLSDASEQYPYTGNFGAPARDLRVEVQEEAAPVAVSKTENSTPAQETQLIEENSTVYNEEMVQMFPDEVDPIETELESLLQEQETLESRMMEAIEKQDYDTYYEVNDRYKTVTDRIAELERESAEADFDRIDSIQDEDAPPEMEAPYYGEPSEPAVPEDPFEDRDYSDVGNRSVKAYMYENPEVKPFFQAEARVMLGDLGNSIRGEKIFNDQVYYDSGGEKGWSGTKRQTTDDIAYLLDSGYTYAEIEKGLNAIIEDNGKENNAVSKRIEFALNDRLLHGYTGVWGETIPADQGYINLLNEKQINEYSQEAFSQFMANADQYAPEEDIAPTEDFSAVQNIRSYGQQTFMPPRQNIGSDDIAPTYDVTGKKGVPDGQQAFMPDAGVEPKLTRKQLHQNIMDRVKASFQAKGFDFDTVLKKAKDLSTFATVDNTPQRVMEKALGYKQGQALSDLTVNQVAKNETQGIRWLNSFTNRKNGLLAQISKQYNIKPGSKKSAAAQMYAEGFYVGENDEIIAYGDRELAMDFPNVKVQQQIKGLARDPRIRQIYDETLASINASRARNAYPEIPRLDNYFLHFRAMEDTFSRLGLPFNPNDIRAKDLPTDLNGVTADLKPGQPYFASAMHRTGKRTSFDLLGGLEKYLTSAKNQIYHIDDIQTLRAVRNYIAEMYGQATGLENLSELSDEEAQQRIEDVYGSHLSTFAKFLNEEANVLAGKTALIDRGLEGIIGRRGITFLNALNRQVGSNMVGYNISSSLTNFLAPVQALAKSRPDDFIKGFAQTVFNRVGSIVGQGDGFAEASPVMIRRKGADAFYRTPWQKLADPGYLLMGAVDDFSTEMIARAKYNELIRKGMDSQQAHYETDKWVSRLMGDRSLGQQPQLYNSKMLGLVTKFQLEVRNQLDSQFHDTIQDAIVSTEDVQNGLLRNAKRAAKIAYTFAALAGLQHLFGKAFESVAGYNPAFDIIEAIIKAFGWDDEEDDEDTVLDNLEEAFFELMGDMPYVSALTGGRIPIESALPIEELYKGEDQYGNEKSRWKTLAEAAPYYILPGGAGQLKKTLQGLSMFDEDHPIAGSYTDSGNLRFPVEDTTQNRVQAGLFGQWASQNARDYFDEDYAPLKENQIQEFIDSDMPIRDYRDYREGLKDLSKQAEKVSYINGLDLSDKQKDVLKSYLFDEAGYAEDNPEKYAFLEKEGIGYLGWKQLDSDTQEAWSWAFTHQDEYRFYKENGVTPEDYSVYRIPMLDFDDEKDEAYQWAFDYPDKATMGKVFSNGVKEYRQYTKTLSEIKADKDESGKTINGSRKDKVLDYINSLDIDYYEKLILFKNEYNADDTYNSQIIEYINSRSDFSYEEKVTILKELGFEVSADGRITW